MNTTASSRYLRNLALSCIEEHGGTAVEYALLAALIAAVVAGILGIFGTQVRELFITVNGAF